MIARFVFLNPQVEHVVLDSHDTILFRKFLHSSDGRDAFQRYLRLVARDASSLFNIRFPKEDIEFWLEVQKFKVLFLQRVL